MAETPLNPILEVVLLVKNQVHIYQLDSISNTNIEIIIFPVVFFLIDNIKKGICAWIRYDC